MHVLYRHSHCLRSTIAIASYPKIVLSPVFNGQRLNCSWGHPSDGMHSEPLKVHGPLLITNFENIDLLTSLPTKFIFFFPLQMFLSPFHRFSSALGIVSEVMKTPIACMYSMCSRQQRGLSVLSSLQTLLNFRSGSNFARKFRSLYP